MIFLCSNKYNNKHNVIFTEFLKIKYITSKKIPAGHRQLLLGHQGLHREVCVSFMSAVRSISGRSPALSY